MARAGKTPAAPRVAIDLGGTKIAAAWVHGADVRSKRVVATGASQGPRAVLHRMVSVVQQLGRTPEGVFVAATGRVEAGHVTAVNEGTMPDWGVIPLARELEEALGVPVRVMNDAQAAAWGEYRFGAGRAADPFAFVTVSTGIGCGFVSHGRVLRGAHGLAGHVGFWGGGREGGYLEARASGRSLARDARQVYGAEMDAEQVVAKADEGDLRARDLLDTLAHRLGGALVDIQLALDPARIAVGGGLGLADGMIERLRAQVHAQSASSAGVVPELVPAELGSDAGLIGVAAWPGDVFDG